MASSSANLPLPSFTSSDPEIAAIDASLRVPVMACLLSSVHWLVLGTIFLVYASSLTHPQDSIPLLGLFVDLSNNFSFFTYGRLWPAALDALIYGWASTAGLGLAIWVISRASRTVLRSPGVLTTAIVFWNIGVTIGLSGVLLGYGSGVELLEFPGCAFWLLWPAYALFGFWAILSFAGRRSGITHLSQAWIVAALLAFPGLLGGGAILLASHNLPGANVIQDLIDVWYVHGIYTLWLAPLALGLLYYLVPKISGLPLRYAGKARMAFWAWFICAPWTAVHDMVGGPFPAMTVAFGLILSGLIFLPVALIGISLVSSSLEGEERHHGGVVLPFLSLGAMVFVAAGISEQLLSIRSVNEILRFTLFREANQLLWIYGVFSFTAYGAIYYIVPRLLNFGWRSSLLIRVHYYASVYGILLVLAMLGFGGVMQGMTLENSDPQVTMATVDGLTNSFHIATTMCLSLISLGNGIFALHLGWTFLVWLRTRVRVSPLASELLVEPYQLPAPAPLSAPLKEVSP